MKQRRKRGTPILQRSDRAQFGVIKIHDSGIFKINSDFLGYQSKTRDPEKIKSNLLHQFIQLNTGHLSTMNVQASVKFTKDNPELEIRTGIKIGALPLISPLTGKPDVSLVIEPRFSWNGIGPLLSVVGYRVLPTILPMPHLKISERLVPPWVLSSIALSHLKRMVQEMHREFEFTTTHLARPKGAVNWTRYASKQLPHGKYLDFPCNFPTLETDRDLKSAVHFVVRKLIASLQDQKQHGLHVINLIDRAQQILDAVKTAPALLPSHHFFTKYRRKGIASGSFIQGIEAMEWIATDRGLGGIGTQRGLPWQMSMEELFESYIESITHKFAQTNNYNLLVGRKRETITALQWNPPYMGSQKFLLPDFMLRRNGTVLIVDAKYKEHWEDLNYTNWHQLEESIRERHRHDLLQILAYTAPLDQEQIFCVLVYPCRQETYDSLKKRNRLFHRAEIPAGKKSLSIILTAIPLNFSLEEGAQHLKKTLTQ